MATRQPPPAATLPTPAAGGDSRSALLVAIRSGQGGLKKASDRQLADQPPNGRNALFDEIIRGKALKKVLAPACHSPPLIAPECYSRHLSVPDRRPRPRSATERVGAPLCYAQVIVSESPRKSEQPFTLGGVSVTAILARRAALDGDEDDDDNSEWDDDEWDDDEWDEQL